MRLPFCSIARTHIPVFKALHTVDVNMTGFVFRRLLAITILCTLILAPSVTAIAAENTNRIPVILTFNQILPEQAIKELTAKLGPFQVKYKYKNLPGMAAGLTQQQIEALSNLPFIKRIERDEKVAHITLEPASQWFGADAAASDFGVDGNLDGLPTYSRDDIVIAIIDTGIDNAHVDLNQGKVIGWTDYVNGRTQPYDDNGHGTHVASIAAGTGAGNPAYKGVAPGAALVGVKVLDSTGSGYISDVNYGIQWVIDNKAQYGIEVMSMSLGIAGSSDGTDSTSVLVNQAVQAGIIAVVAAGNSGPAKYTIGSPAAAELAITVGAMADVGAQGFYLASFSSRGPTKDGRIKPDLCGPGVSITAAKAGSGNGYITYSGTSMATPFVSGTVALMLNANHALTPTEVKNMLLTEAIDWGSSGADVEDGYGRLDTYKAVQTARGTTGSGGPVVPSHTFAQGSLSSTGDANYWSYTVTSPSYPVAITLIIPNWQSSTNPDFDLYLYDPDGALTASSTGVSRQETIATSITKTGTYKVKAYSYSGSGSYFFDLSAGLGSSPIDNPPSVSIADPKQEETVTGTKRVRVTASDDKGLAKVELSIDAGSYLDITANYDSPNSCYFYDWDSTKVSDGPHSLVARATDTSSQAVTSSQVTVTVLNNPSKIHMDGIVLSTTKKGINTQAKAVVTVVDAAGKPVQGATVYGTWSGLVNTNLSGVTDAGGQVVFNSTPVKNAKGTFTFSVTNAVKTGWTYDSNANKVTSASITV